MTHDEEEEGFTCSQFEATCERMDGPGRVPTESIAPFLDRCCKAGLLTKRKDAWRVRYVPTPLLGAMFERD